VRETSIRVGSRTVRYLEAGAGAPVVLLHAFPLSADMWRPQLDHVPPKFRFIAPDLRGFGPRPAEPAGTLDDMAADVIGWLDALAIERAVIGGASMGGYVTFALLRLAPERFSGILLANTKASADTAEGRAGRDKMSALVRSGGPPAVAEQMIPKLLGETARRSQPQLAPLVRQLIEGNTADGLDGAIQAMKNRPDSTDLLSEIGTPALVIAGDEDTLIPVTESEAMQRALPHSQLAVLRGCGHLSNLESPDQFSAALHNFLDTGL